MRTSRGTKLRLWGALVAVLCAAVVAGCGDGDSSSTSVPPREYVRSACSTIGLWHKRIVDGSGILQRRVDTMNDLEAVRAEFVGFLTSAIEETDTMVEDTREIGHPDVPGGQALADNLVKALERYSPLIAEARTRTEQMSTTDEREFRLGMLTVGQPFAQEAALLATLLPDLARTHAPALAPLIKGDPACQNL